MLDLQPGRVFWCRKPQDPGIGEHPGIVLLVHEGMAVVAWSTSRTRDADEISLPQRLLDRLGISQSRFYVSNIEIETVESLEHARFPRVALVPAEPLAAFNEGATTIWERFRKQRGDR